MRVQALARAIYSKRKVVILDDVMSGLDAETENVLFNNIFGQNGLLRREDITVVLATNAGMMLCHYNHNVLLLRCGSASAFLRRPCHCP